MALPTATIMRNLSLSKNQFTLKGMECVDSLFQACSNMDHGY